MYTVKEAATLLGVSPHTVRYYTNQNLTPHLDRGRNGARLFRDIDLEYLRVTIYLRSCGMPVQKIRAYFSLAEQGESTIRERYQMLLEQQESLNEQMRRLAQSQAYISHKLEVYSGYMRETKDTQDGAAQSVPSK